MFLLMFDSVNHRPSLAKIESVSLDETAVRWVNSSLARRTCRAEELLQDAGIESGVPQEPLLFFLFINNLRNVINWLMLVFADEVEKWPRARNAEFYRTPFSMSGNGP